MTATHNITMTDRAQAYRMAMPGNYPDLRIVNDRLYDMWLMGNDYTNTSGYYGAYPNGYLKRMNAIFQDKKSVLHLFSGKLPKGDYLRFDCNPDSGAEIVGQASRLSSYIHTFARDILLRGGFDLIFADPPYSHEDADRYGVALVSRDKVIAECHKILRPGGHIVWLDQAFPRSYDNLPPDIKTERMKQYYNKKGLLKPKP